MQFSILSAVLACSAFDAASALNVESPRDVLPATITRAAKRQEASSITAVSDCHAHGTEQWCMAGTAEYEMGVTVTSGETLPTAYTDCHTHSGDTYCVDDEGSDVELLVDDSASSTEDSASTTEEDAAQESQELDCHFHAGVEHCTGGEEAEEEAVAEEEELDCHFHAGVEHCTGGSSAEASSSSATLSERCTTRQREYDVPLRIGLLFVVLVTGGLGSFGPVLLARFPVVPHTNTVLLVLKQFGTGVILSTAFIHLYTHAYLMFSNECIGTLEYEATTSALVMAGIFLSALIEYIGSRLARWHSRKSSNLEKSASGSESEGAPAASAADPITGAKDTTGVSIMEAGILFHSILIGLTLVVAGDSFFKTLFIVIVFHQFFEGLALGSCIAALPNTRMLYKLIMASLFALITPLGMAIGIGVLNQFNGNDSSTLIAIGTLDAFSAGILIWVGLVEMLAHDWFHGPALVNAGGLKAGVCGFALICGMVLMSVLGKWA